MGGRINSVTEGLDVKLALLTREDALLKRANIWDLTQNGKPLIQRSS